MIQLPVLSANLPLTVPSNASANGSQTPLPPLKLQFETDERHFVILAWLQYVGGRNPFELKGEMHPAEKRLHQHLASLKLPEEMFVRHRRAYDSFLKELDPSFKPTLLIGASVRYGAPPDFSLANLDAVPAPRHKLDEILYMTYRQLPAPELLREFYQRAGLAELWRKELAEAHARAISYYRPRAEKVLEDTYAFLGVAMKEPVSLSINLLGNFGFVGRTIYSPWEKRYLIKLHFNPPKPDNTREDIASFEYENLQVMRHEFTHAVLNEIIIEHVGLLLPKLRQMGQAPYLEWLLDDLAEYRAAEWIAASVGYMDLEPEWHDRVIFDFHNPLYKHFLEQLPTYRASGKNFAEFLPEFFESLDVEKESQRWLEHFEQ